MRLWLLICAVCAPDPDVSSIKGVGIITNRFHHGQNELPIRGEERRQFLLVDVFLPTDGAVDFLYSGSSFRRFDDPILVEPSRTAIQL